MSENAWIRFFPSDWLAGTRGMTAAETGIYISLVAMMYENEGHVKDDRTRLARLCGASSSAFKKALETLVEGGKIIVEDGRLTNDRVLEELSYSREKSSVAREAAKKRWQKTQQKQYPSNADAMPSQSGRNANQKPEPEYPSFTNVQEGASSDKNPRPSPGKKSDHPPPVQTEMNGWGSDEDRFWSMKPDLAKLGVTAGQMGKLIKATGGNFSECLRVVEATRNAKVPRSYFAGAIRRMENEEGLSEPPPPATDPSEPEVVREHRMYGYSVEKLAPDRWRCGAVIYDAHGEQIGG